MSSYRSLARNRDFTALWIGQTVSELGTCVSAFVFPLVAYAVTGSTLGAAAAQSLHLGGLVIALLPAGVLADRVDRRALMRASSAAGVVLHASLGAAALAGALTLPHLLVVALLTGTCAGLFAPSEMSAVRAVVPTDELPTALAQNQARQHVASLVGGPLGGILLGVSRAAPFLFDAVSYAVSWVLLGRVRADLSAPALAPGAERERPLRQVREGFAFVVSRPFFRTMLVYSPLANLMVNAVFFVAVLRLIQDGVDPVHLGLVETAAGAGGILGAVAAPWLIDRLPTGLLTVAVAWSFVPLLVPMVLWSSTGVVALALAVGLFLNPAGNAGIGAYRLALTPTALQGRVQSTMQLASMSTLPFAAALGGGLLALLGGPGATAALAVGVVLVALVPTLSPSVRRVPRPAAWTSSTTPSAPAALVEPTGARR